MGAINIRPFQSNFLPSTVRPQDPMPAFVPSGNNVNMPPARTTTQDSASKTVPSANKENVSPSNKISSEPQSEPKKVN